MNPTACDLSENAKVWRYMRFWSFVWTLIEKQIWLSRIDQLGDSFEFQPSQSETARYLAQIGDVSLTAKQKDDQLRENLISYRERVFASCWHASPHESEGMWKRYCADGEGVALQTTLAKLRSAVKLDVRPVCYDEPAHGAPLPTLFELATRKRPEFRYESEVRVLLFWEGPTPKGPFVGMGREWDIETAIDNIWVNGDWPFMETVSLAIRQLAPALENSIRYSRLRHKPAF